MPTATIAATKAPFLPIIPAHHYPNECLTAGTTITNGAPPNSGTVAGVAIGVQSGLTRCPGDNRAMCQEGGFHETEDRGIVVSMGIALAASAGAVRAQNSPAGAGIDAALRGAVERKDVPGVVALITDRKRVLYQGAFGVADVSTGRALAADALFRIASMTKPVTSTAAMQLVEQGRFGLDDPVEKYLPEFANLKVFESFDAANGAYRLRPASRPPTVRHILTHTSGLGYPFTSAILRDFKPQPGENYPFGGPLLFDPGERWHYGTSTDVVGKLVEKVSGQKLEDYFRQHIFAPLQMSDT